MACQLSSCALRSAFVLNVTVALSCREWRLNVAHQLSFVDDVTGVPLAARVCYNVAGTPYSFQADSFQDILNYVGMGQGVPLGPLLCFICGFMWFVKARPVSDHRLQ